MILLELFWGFLKVGAFAFGGAYAAIPLIRDIVLSYGWLGEDALAYMIAVSESTPGPIMVNLATGGIERTQAMRDRYHSCDRPVYGHQELSARFRNKR